MTPELGRVLGLVVGVVIGSAWAVAITWTVVLLVRRDAERSRVGCPPPTGCVLECTHDVSHLVTDGEWVDPAADRTGQDRS